ncbi:hypothetical protein EVAR_53496_1 [Eumeta japonica]|uniref:Uncharacterized protein n=1 Tax=Eumeta variegata TaxID=151549 RepID=A0A4C1Y7N6_EUMVA|nr:hypothetical protein EVAR_53496_1 [Eumeta japonica]
MEVELRELKARSASIAAGLRVGSQNDTDNDIRIDTESKQSHANGRSRGQRTSVRILLPLNTDYDVAASAVVALQLASENCSGPLPLLPHHRPNPLIIKWPIPCEDAANAAMIT